MSSNLPTGTVTFLFTDIEGSTRLLERIGNEAYAAAMVDHDAILREAITDCNGVVVKTIGDGFFAAFAEAPDAVRAAATAQKDLEDHTWPIEDRIRVRMGLHTGRGVLGVGDDYVGIDVHKAARISDAAHGGQIIMSAATRALIDSRPAMGVSLVDLGSHRLKDLVDAEELFQIRAPGLEESFPPLRAIDEKPGNLPEQLTSFVGRVAEVADGVELLQEARLITLTGPGGTGKTRLSLAIASEAATAFADGAFFVPLAAISDPNLVATEILDVLGAKVSGGRPPEEALLDRLRNSDLLLVLDNFEQILDASSLVARLLAGSPGVRIIVTSRAPLHIRGERELPVRPLDTVSTAKTVAIEEITQSGAVQLFMDRARAIRPDFALTADNVSAVVELTSDLDGLPLAIELAASRIKLLTPQAIVDRLDNRLLEQRAPDRPDRQRTITNAIGWSYDLLDEPVRRLFERCAVFVGDARLDEIEAVCGPADEIGVDILEGLATLVDNSLLGQQEVRGEPRFRMLVVVREFAYAALVARGDDGMIQRRHAHAYAELAHLAEPHLLTSRHAAWLALLTADHENIRAAFDWAVAAPDVDLALQMAGDLWRFWQTRGHLLEALQRIDAALGLEGGSPRLRARALEALGGVRYWTGLWVEAREPYEEALAIMRGHGDRADLANALYNASFAVGYTGDPAGARKLLDESRELYEAIGDHGGVGRTYWGISDQAAYVQDWDGVIQASLMAVQELEQADAPFDLAWAWFMIAHAHRAKGDVVEARAHLERAAPFFLETRDLSAFALLLYLSAATHAAGSDRARAARMLGAADALSARIGTGITEVELNRYPELSDLNESEDPEIRAGYDEGRHMSLDEAIALVLDR